mgnify:CR=1 FL=1
MNLAGMLIGHMVGDYVLQNDWMAQNKTKSTAVAAVHAALWTAAVCGFGLLLEPWAIAWLFVTHFAIDRWRLASKAMDYTGQAAFKSGMGPWSMIAVDNTWHLVTIWAAWIVKPGMFAALLLLCSPAFAQDITWERNGVKQADFGWTNSAADRGASNRETLAMLYPKLTKADTLICRGEADFGKEQEVYLPNCNYKGIGAKWITRVTIDGDGVNKPSATPGFVVGSYASFDGFELVGECWDANEDGCCIGWRDVIDGEKVRADYVIPPVGEFYFTNGTLNGKSKCDWTVYAWSPKAKSRKIVIQKSQLYGGRFIVAAMGSSSSTTPIQDVLIEDCKAWLDGNSVKSFGESSSGNVDTGGVLTVLGIREGKAVLRNVQVDAIGLTAPYSPKFGCPRIAALCTDSYYSPGQPCDVTIDGCTSSITKNTATVANDIDLRRSKLTVIRHEGTGENGSFSKWSK